MTSSVIAIGRNSLASLSPSKSAGRGHDGKSFGLEMICDQLARGGIVVDDENAIGCWANGGPLTDRLRACDCPRRPGRRRVKTEPLPGSLVTVTSPPIMRASLRVMASPSPVPP